VYAVDLHAHTRFFHGKRRLGDAFDPTGAKMLAWTARRRGLDGVVVTNHDYHTPFPAPFLLPGIEISTTRGHLLVVGPNPPAETEPGALTPEDAVALAHDRDCAAILAHPYRNSTLKDTDVAFDAVEVNGKHPEHRDAIVEIARAHDVPVVGGSDAHLPFEVGRAYTTIDAPELTPTTVVDAIRDGRVTAHLRFGPLHDGLRTAYDWIHHQKGHLE